MKVCKQPGIVLALIVACGAIRMAHAVEDKLTLVKNNEAIVGRIQQCDLDNVTIETKDKGKRTCAPAEVAEIEWDGDSDFRSAQGAFKNNQYGTSASLFKSIKGNKEDFENLRSEVKPYISYAYAESLYRLGKAGEAVTEFEKFVTENQKSYYVPLSIASMVDAVIQDGQFAKVSKLLDQLRGMGAEQRAMADYYEGNMLLAQKKNAEAARKYGAAAEASNAPETKAVALMGQAKCALEDKNLAKAREFANKATEKSTSPKVAGFAHLIAGNACMLEAEPLKGQEKLNKLMDAVLEFMRNDVQYAGDPRTQPESLFKAGQCLEQMAKQFPDTHGNDRMRAVALYNKLVGDRQFRGSLYVSEANKALQAIK